MKPFLTAALVTVLVVVGVLAVFAGEADDSPGLQGIGVLLALAAIVLCARAFRRRRSTLG